APCPRAPQAVRVSVALLGASMPAGCSGRGSAAPAVTPVGGSVIGLIGTGLVLRNTGGDALPVSRSGTFEFQTKAATRAAYSINIAAQPTSPAQKCIVKNGSGVVTRPAVTAVVVICPLAWKQIAAGAHH